MIIRDKDGVDIPADPAAALRFALSLVQLAETSLESCRAALRHVIALSDPAQKAPQEKAEAESPGASEPPPDPAPILPIARAAVIRKALDAMGEAIKDLHRRAGLEAPAVLIATGALKPGEHLPDYREIEISVIGIGGEKVPADAVMEGLRSSHGPRQEYATDEGVSGGH